MSNSKLLIGEQISAMMFTQMAVSLKMIGGRCLGHLTAEARPAIVNFEVKSVIIFSTGCKPMFAAT